MAGLIWGDVLMAISSYTLPVWMSWENGHQSISVICEASQFHLRLLLHVICHNWPGDLFVNESRVFTNCTSSLIKLADVSNNDSWCVAPKIHCVSLVFTQVRLCARVCVFGCVYSLAYVCLPKCDWVCCFLPKLPLCACEYPSVCVGAAFIVTMVF